MTHECPANGCSLQLPRSVLACKPHWFKVSPATRAHVNRMWRAYQRDPDEFSSYVSARQDAVDEMNAP